MSWFLTIRNFKLLEPYERKLSRTVLRGESSRKGTDLPGKVKKTIEIISEITDIYVNGFNKMVNDPNFTPDELVSISAGYAKLLEEGGSLVTELKDIVTGGNGLSLSDKERMEVIDQVYTKMVEYRNLTKYYTQKSISVSYIRAKAKNDMSRVLDLYGSPSERYW